MRKILGKITIVKLLYNFITNAFFCTITIFSPSLNTRLRYWCVYGKKLNLEKPTNFYEKLLWLKLKKYMYNPLVIQCADKFAVRKYVEKVGLSEILNDLIAVYDDPRDIDWDLLPDQFVLKMNFGAGMNVVCSNKNLLSADKVKRQLKIWMKKKCWLSHAEMQYKYAPKKIVCEKFLNCEGEGAIPDYKVYCFNGNPKAVLVMHDRDVGVKTEFFDCEWNLLNNTKKYLSPDKVSLKPCCLNEMLNAARLLSKPFPFVRCDFYVVNGKLYFGELTFTPAGGLYTSQTDVHGTSMAELLDLSHC